MTNIPIDETVFWIDRSSSESLKLRGRVPSRDPWLFDSPLNFKIEVTLGDQNYVTEYSEPFEVVVADTCNNASLVTVSLGPYIVPDDETTREFSLPQIKDTISSQYTDDFGDGSGVDLCGQRTYELFERVNN